MPRATGQRVVGPRLTRARCCLVSAKALSICNVNLTAREREIVDLLRAEPLLDAAAIAERIGSTRAAVSVHLSNLTRKGVVLGRGYLVRPEAGSVLVVGGAVLDTKVRTAAAPVLGTSNPGTASATVGGVGRNIAENLARLGRPTVLVAAVGDDPAGDTVHPAHQRRRRRVPPRRALAAPHRHLRRRARRRRRPAHRGRRHARHRRADAWPTSPSFPPCSPVPTPSSSTPTSTPPSSAGCSPRPRTPGVRLGVRAGERGQGDRGRAGVRRLGASCTPSPRTSTSWPHSSGHPVDRHRRGRLRGRRRRPARPRGRARLGAPRHPRQPAVGRRHRRMPASRAVLVAAPRGRGRRRHRVPVTR